VPLALLLQQQLGILVKGVGEKLRHWDEAMETISTVAERLRSAYLVHWFGTALPSEGDTLKVGLANMHELRARWMAVGGPQAGATPPVGPNLTEPLLGYGGALVGIFASPLNGILLTTAIGSLVDTWWAKVLAVVNWLTAGLLMSAALSLGGVGFPVGLIVLAAGGELRDLFDFLGAAAELAVPLQQFWEQVTGPREAVRNPLLRELLLVGDRVAALVASLLGTFAVLITRVGPLLESLRLGIAAVAGLVLDLWPVIALALGQTVEVVIGLVSGPGSVTALLQRVLSVLGRTLRRLGTQLAAVFAELGSDVAWLADWGGWRIDIWWRAAEPGVRTLTVDHPTVRYLRSFMGQLGVVSAWRGRETEEDKKKKSSQSAQPSPPGMLDKVEDWVKHKTGMPSTMPKPPVLPKLPPVIPLGAIGPIVDVVEFLRRFGLDVGPANPLEVGAEGRRVLKRAAHPPSVFGAEWAALEAEARRPEPLARTLEVATYLSLARRVVGPAAATGVRGLEDALSRIDAVIRTERRRLPVKDVPEPTQLTPVIRRLRVRSRGRTSDALQAWVEEVRRELNADPYTIPMGA
jgi:hypothetical protein